jgi:hypothetical protein
MRNAEWTGEMVKEREECRRKKVPNIDVDRQPMLDPLKSDSSFSV